MGDAAERGGHRAISWYDHGVPYDGLTELSNNNAVEAISDQR